MVGTVVGGTAVAVAVAVGIGVDVAFGSVVTVGTGVPAALTWRSPG